MPRQSFADSSQAAAAPTTAWSHNDDTESVFELTDATVGGVEFVSGRAVILDGGSTLCFVFTDSSGVTTSELPVPLAALANIRIGRTRPRLVFKVPFDVAEPFLNINNGFDDEDVAALGDEGFVNICAFTEDAEASYRFGSVMAPVLQREQSRRSAVRSSTVRRSATRAVSVSGVFGASVAREVPQPPMRGADGPVATPSGVALGDVSRALHLSPPTQREADHPSSPSHGDEEEAHTAGTSVGVTHGIHAPAGPEAAAADVGGEDSDSATAGNVSEVVKSGDDASDAAEADEGAAVSASSPIRARVQPPGDVRAEVPPEKSLRSMAREASLLVASQQDDFRLPRRRHPDHVDDGNDEAEDDDPHVPASTADGDAGEGRGALAKAAGVVPKAAAASAATQRGGLISLSQGAGDVRLSRRRPAASAQLRATNAFDADVTTKLAHTAPRNTRRPARGAGGHTDSDDDDSRKDDKETLGSLLAARFGTRPSAAQSSAAKRRAASNRFDTLMGTDDAADDGDIPMTASSASSRLKKKDGKAGSAAPAAAKKQTSAGKKKNPPAKTKAGLLADVGGGSADEDDFDDIAAEVMKTTSGKSTRTSTAGGSSKQRCCKKNPTSAGRTPYLSDAAAALRAAAGASAAAAPTPSAEEAPGAGFGASRASDPFDADAAAVEHASEEGEQEDDEEVEYGGAAWTATTVDAGEPDDDDGDAGHAARRLSFKLTPYANASDASAAKLAVASATAARSAMKGAASAVPPPSAADEVFIESPPPDNLDVSPEMPAAPPPSAAGASSTRRRRSMGDVLASSSAHPRGADASLSSKKSTNHPPTAATSPVAARGSKKGPGATSRGSGHAKKDASTTKVAAAAPSAAPPAEAGGEFLSDFPSPSRPGPDGTAPSVRRASMAGARRAREAPSMAPDAASVEASLRDMLAPLSRGVGGADDDDDDDEVGALAPMMALMVSKQLQRAQQKRSDETARHAELAHALLEQLLDKFKRHRSEAFDRARSAVGGVTAEFVELRSRIARLESDMEAALARARTAESAIDDAERRLGDREDKTVDSAHTVLDRKLGLSPTALTSTRWRPHRASATAEVST